MKTIIGIIGIAFLLIACGSQESSSTQQTNTKANPIVEKKEPSPGEKLYIQHCAACHQKNGKGLKALYPPVAEADWVSGDKTRLIEAILYGLQGEIEVNGQKYSGVMTAYEFLTDEEIAQVLTYIRTNFGNSSSPITADEVAAVRENG